MRILDRYVTVSFLKNYCISFMVLVGMYVVLDMVVRFDDFASISSKTGASGYSAVLALIGGMADYYFYQCFMFFVQLSGIIPVVAAAFTLIRFSRFNELAAVLAAGVPLLRVAMPIIVVSVALNALLLVDQELVIPKLIPKLVRDPEDVARIGPKKYFIQLMQDPAGHGLLNAGMYDPADPPTMSYLDFIEQVNGRPVAHIAADKAVWDAKGKVWRLTNGTRVEGIQPNTKRSPEMPVDTVKTTITPEQIALYRESDYVEFLSTAQIDGLLNSKAYGQASLLRVKHFRFTQPLMNVVLLLLAIPCVLIREPNRMKTAIMQCLIVTGLCMAGIFMSHQLAGQNSLGPDWANTWPALMAWVPVFVFLPVAIWMLDRLHTKKS
jgi:lipopolysaccharide export system permease protein